MTTEDDETTATIPPLDLDDGATGPDRAAAAFDELRTDGPDPEHKGWPKGKKRGTCQQCGAEADSPSGTWCAEHRKVRPDRVPRPRPRSRSSSSRPSPPREPRGTPLATELRVQLELIAQLWSFRDPVCAGALAAQAKPMADYWAARARASTRVARVLDGVVSSGGWLGAVSVHAPFAIAVWAHHVQPTIDARTAGIADAPEPSPDGAGPLDAMFTEPEVAKPWLIDRDQPERYTS